MSYLNRIWVAASVAVVHDHQAHKLKAALRALRQGKHRFSSSSSSACGPASLRPLASGQESDAAAEFMENIRRKQQAAEDSLLQVMYLIKLLGSELANCTFRPN